MTWPKRHAQQADGRLTLHSSTSTFIKMADGYLWLSLANAGAMAWHGPHLKKVEGQKDEVRSVVLVRGLMISLVTYQLAIKSTTTNRGPASASLEVNSSSLWITVIVSVDMLRSKTSAPWSGNRGTKIVVAWKCCQALSRLPASNKMKVP
jgi:hypothetical protein